jgi:hypothetical protein
MLTLRLRVMGARAATDSIGKREMGELCAFNTRENLFSCCKLTLLFSPGYSRVVEKGRLRDWLAICSKNPTALKREMGGFSKQATQLE